MKLKLADGLSLPLEVVTQKLAWLGVTGSGKTYGASKLAELLWHAGAQFVVLDPVGVWYGLRLAKDGKKPSAVDIPIFGGLHGDVPLEPTAGALLANLVVDKTLSAIIDVSQFESDAQKARFGLDFADRFFFRKKAAPSAVHVFLEECQEFVPQNPQKGEERMLHAFTRLQKLGRNFGIGSSYISQRPQEVNKKALNMAQTLFVFRTTGTHERGAIEKWIEDKALDEDIAGDLPKIATGDCHVWSPEFLKISEVVHILEKETFNASSTPEVGAAAKARELAPIDLEQVRADMAATIERAKAEDPRELRQQIAALRKELGAKVSIPNPKEKISVKRVEVPVLKDGQLARAERVLQQIDKAAERLSEFEEDLRVTAKEIRDAIEKTRQPVIQAVDWGKQPAHAAPGIIRPPKPAQGVAAHKGAGIIRPTDGTVDRYQADVLIALAKLHALGLDDAPKLHVAALARKSTRSSTWDSKLADLSKRGLVRYTGNGGIAATDAGLGAVPAQEQATGREIIEGYKAILSGYQNALLEPLLAARGEAMTRDEWAERANKSRTSSTFDSEASQMRAIGVIELEPGGRVKLASRLAEWL